MFRPLFPAASFLLLLAISTDAQLSSGGRPVSARASLSAEVPLALLPAPDIAALKEQDEISQDWPLRYGAVVETRLDCAEAGLWEETADGDLVWRLRVQSPGAHSLGLLFTDYQLPAGGQLFLYDSERRTVLGAFTSETRQPNGMLAIQPIAGDSVVIEYAQPAFLRARPRLVVGEVVHDYRGIFGFMQDGAQRSIGGGCLIDINCPEGDPYQDIKRAVIMVLNGGTLCSAGMLNNTAQDGTPYFLTADHCGSMFNVVAVFDYERPNCGSGAASTSRTISGASRIERSDPNDSQLYQLSSAPPASYKPFFAGWDRRVLQPAPTIGISHPAGEPRKIAIDNDAVVNSGNFWTCMWERGYVLGGSSGSPLFNGSQRVLGPACCVSNFICGNQLVYYGKLRIFWSSFPTVSAALDPLGLGVPFFDGFDPFQAIAIPYNGSGVNPDVYSTVTRPTLGTVWEAQFEALPGATDTLILAYATRSQGTFVPAGELLVLLGTPRLLTSIEPVVGGISLHSNALPNSAGLIGLTIFTQGFEFGPGLRQLTNGVELRLR